MDAREGAGGVGSTTDCERAMMVLRWTVAVLTTWTVTG